MTVSRTGLGVATGALVGGTAGAIASKDDRVRGALGGAAIGGGLGALVGKLTARKPPSVSSVPHVPTDAPNWLRWSMERSSPQRATELYGRWKTKSASPSFFAFGDELIKIAFYQTLRNGFTQALKEGWHGTTEQIAAGDGATWFGKGRQIKPGMSRGARMLDEFTSLGGATRGLPVGAKSMMAIGTGMMARDALRPVDPTGQERSRTERLTGLAANTVGGLVGSAAGNRLLPGLWGSLAGGALGSLGAEKLVTAPFHHRNPAQVQQPQTQQPYGAQA
jgi:hypothetical protein